MASFAAAIINSCRQTLTQVGMLLSYC